MKRIFIAALLFCTSSALADNGLWIEGKDRPADRVNVNLKSLSPDAYMKVSERVNQAVVNISTTQVVKGAPRRFQGRPAPQSPFGDFFGDDFFEHFFGMPMAPQEEQRQQSLGSGFILNAQGYIVTNNHVVEKADTIKVVLSDESEYVAKLIGRDPKIDVALLKIDAKKELGSVVLGDSGQMKVGEVVVAIGNPFGLSHSVTHGIISAKERSIGYGAYDDFIQTDASINPGNSGGPLLNLYGEVIGINAAIVASGQGIGFAIPINLAKNVLLKLKKDGKVARGWLGVSIQKVTSEHAKALKLPRQTGALVADVAKGSPAAKAGLKPGDVITRFGAKEIKDWHELPISVADTVPGEKVDVEVIRGGEKKIFTVGITQMEDDAAPSSLEEQSSETDRLGLKVQNLTPEMARAFGLEDTKGVVVTGLDGAGEAAAKGVRRGDIILEVNRKPVPDRAAYQSAVKGLKKGDSVLLLVKREKAPASYIAFTL